MSAASRRRRTIRATCSLCARRSTCPADWSSTRDGAPSARFPTHASRRTRRPRHASAGTHPRMSTSRLSARTCCTRSTRSSTPSRLGSRNFKGVSGPSSRPRSDAGVPLGGDRRARGSLDTGAGAGARVPGQVGISVQLRQVRRVAGRRHQRTAHDLHRRPESVPRRARRHRARRVDRRTPDRGAGRCGAAAGLQRRVRAARRAHGGVSGRGADGTRADSRRIRRLHRAGRDDQLRSRRGDDPVRDRSGRSDAGWAAHQLAPASTFALTRAAGGALMRFRDQPIRQKLLVLMLASSASALVLASGGFLAWDITRFRQEVQQDLDAQAAIVAENSAAPLTFNDTQAAGETLAVMRLRPRVAMACLYKSDQLFATFDRDAGVRCPGRPPAKGAITATSYTLIRPVTVAGGAVGTLYISRDLEDLTDRLRVGAAAVAASLLVALVASFLIARRIQLAIAAPLLQLAGTARTISTEQDYSIRVTPASNDEVGVVIEAFNAMLDRIAERNSELSRANRLKDEFLATLSHELRTPLGAVLGWTRVLRATGAEGATRQRALEAIERNARAQARLIEDILEISRIVTGKLSIRVRPVDLAEIIDAAIEVVSPAAAA